jgi:hypothetical protein
MPGFFQYYFNIQGGGTEKAVNCPFPHHTSTGLEYFETHPSAHVNLKERVFHCKVCGTGHSEMSFIQTVLGCTYANAIRLAKAFDNTEDMAEWRNLVPISQDAINLCHQLGIADDVINELDLKSNSPGTISFPVSMYGKLIDIRTYEPGGDPKVRSRAAAAYGMVIPLDIWQATANRVTLVCAGEKDMAVARSHGFNAITLTGGEMTLPLSPHWFKNKDLIIVYDHDAAGIAGAHKLASYLLDYCHTIKVCTGFHEICKEEGEDITDFFTKYHGTREQLIAYMDATHYYTPEDCIKNSPIPRVSLQQATTPEYINKIVRSNIQVAAISEVQYMLPTTIAGEKAKDANKDDTMDVGEVREWALTDSTIQDVLHLIDNNFTEDTINSNARALMHIPIKERYIKIRKADKVIVYKAYVTEMFESLNTDTMPMEYTAYSIGTRLESGKKYLVTYKIVPHPYKGQQLVMIIMNAVHANDSVSNFVITNETVGLLKTIQEIPGTVTERMHILIQKAKGLIGYNGNDTLIKILDLAYHTVLTFNFGQFKNVRGYLDTLVVGESRVGKSSTAEALRQTYQLGTFTSLAGNSATIPGLVGGSNKTPGGAYQTKAGLIPQNHKGMIIFEEFGKCNSNIVAELTDIRSSNEVRITRISGTLTLPAMVRMVSLSNVKTYQGEIKSIASYPNGISIVTELVGTAEDIARYDLLAVLSDKGNTIIDPFWMPEAPLPTDVYQARVRWVWSRNAEQISITEEVGRHIIAKANELNQEFNCHIKIFGTEAWKKLCRLSIAIAGYLVSTDTSYQNIIVTQEHVDYAVQLYKELYDNSTFRLREYVENERKYNMIDAEGITRLQEIYIACPALLIMLEQEAKVSRNSLMAAVGLDAMKYNGFVNSLIRGSFIRITANDILPTERFRLGMAQVNRNATITRVGENNV